MTSKSRRNQRPTRFCCMACFKVHFLAFSRNTCLLYLYSADWGNGQELQPWHHTSFTARSDANSSLLNPAGFLKIQPIPPKSFCTTGSFQITDSMAKNCIKVSANVLRNGISIHQRESDCHHLPSQPKKTPRITWSWTWSPAHTHDVGHEGVIRVGFSHEQLDGSQHGGDVQGWSPCSLSWTNAYSNQYFI